MRIAEISNWTGKAISAPRTELKELLKREELDRPGVYILSGINPVTNRPLIYMGEADSVADRIKCHAGKDYWVNVVVIVSKDENLTKAHSKYLEGKLIKKASEANQAEIVNAVASGARLSESDIAEMDVFLSNIYQLLPVLGIDYFRTSEERTSTETELFYCTIKTLSAKGKRSPNGFMVFKGSQAVLGHRPSAKTIRIIRERLISSGVLTPLDDYLIFSSDFEFGSPSTAAGVIRGGNSNGLTQWKNSKGKSLKEFEREETL
ncbi:GIY-YIG nuclease family protein [Chloroflexota bacterium]